MEAVQKINEDLKEAFELIAKPADDNDGKLQLVCPCFENVQDFINGIVGERKYNLDVIRRCYQSHGWLGTQSLFLKEVESLVSMLTTGDEKIDEAASNESSAHESVDRDVAREIIERKICFIIFRPSIFINLHSFIRNS